MSKHPNHPHESKKNTAARQPGGGLHRDWRFWTAVLLMLGAMAMYVLTMDESLAPGGEPAVPADAQ